MTLRTRITVVVAGLGLVAAGAFAVYSYHRGTAKVKEDAQVSAENLLARTVETFMVSTRRFDSDFKGAPTPEDSQRILDDWSRTIAAVDTAVIQDFGKDRNRVRLIGDEQLVGYKPLGGDAVRVEIPFEEDAIRAFQRGDEIYQAQDGEMLRIAAPLWSDAHAGCGGCHIATVEGLDADLDKRILLGSVNVYIPTGAAMAENRQAVLWSVVILGGGVLLLVAVVIIFINKKVVQPLEVTALNIDEAAEQVNTGARQVASASQVLAQGATEQASSVEESSATLEELTSMAHENGARSQEAREITDEAARAVKESDGRMNDLVRAIQEGREASEKTQKIVSTIDEIAFQTNLLALNAAVEAARAGEAGAGFAVVADEVRALAQRASEAAKDTAQLIETTVQKIAHGAQLTELTKEHYQKVGEGALRAAQINAQIAEASGEQAQGVGQVNEAVNQVQQVVQQVSAHSEEAAAAAEELTGQAGSLSRDVRALRSIFS